MVNFTKKMNFYKSRETLDKVKNILENRQKGLYLRFGDGDVNLSTGKHDLLQTSNTKLMNEMRESFAINDDFVLKALPLHCKEYGLEEGMFPGNHECSKEWADSLLNQVRPFWGHLIENVYSNVALHYLACYDAETSINFLKFLKSKEPLCLIGNQNIPSNITNLLFGKNCHHLKTPEKNSYYTIDDTEKNFDTFYKKNSKEYNIIITSMGCSGRVLQKRLYKKYDNLFIFDFGSLMDALCGWNTRAWIELSDFNKDEFLKKLSNV